MRLAARFAAVAVLASLCSPLFAQDKPKPGDVIKLFNGKDLSGWVWFTHDQKAQKIEDVWSVVDGNLHCKGRPPGYIRTEQDYTSYIDRKSVV